MSWTDERVDTLKRLWTEGLSASQIATQLGGVSRNAVIGKVHRLGLEGRNKATPSKADESASDAVAEPSKPRDEPSPATEAPEAASAPSEPTRAAPKVDLSGMTDDAIAPTPLKLKLTELTERTCKWPIGDPMHDDFHFCGHDADEGRPYCEYHAGLAFQPASERRRVR